MSLRGSCWCLCPQDCSGLPEIAQDWPGLEAKSEPLGAHQRLHPQPAPPGVDAGHQGQVEAGEGVKVGEELGAVVGKGQRVVVQLEEPAGLGHRDLLLVAARRPRLLLLLARVEGRGRRSQSFPAPLTFLAEQSCSHFIPRMGFGVENKWRAKAAR